MLHLMESARPARSPRGRWMAASSALHAALIATAASAGTSQVINRTPDAPPDRIIFAAPPPPRASGAPMSDGRPGVDAAAPVRVLIPEVIIPRSPFAIDDVARPASAPGVLPIGTGDPGLVGSPFSPGGVFDEHTVDRAVVARPGNRSPDYPAALRTAGVSGDVLVRFVVDTTGRVERGSVEIISTTHPLFAEAVTRWLPRTRYKPAQAGGAPVRQMVEQRVDFALRP